MHVIATLGDAPTAAIAVLAILLGLLFAARGPRDKRLAGGEAQAGPTFVSLPGATAPDAEPGFVGPEGTIVGHGPIRLGQVGGGLGGAEAAPSADVPAWVAPPAAADAAAEPVAESVAPAEPVVEAEPAAPAQPAESGEAEAAFPGQPEAAGSEPGEPASAAPAVAEPEPAEAAVPPTEADAAEPEVTEPEPEPEPEPEAVEGEAIEGEAAEPAAAESEPELSSEPAWRRYLHKPSVPFRHGGDKLGGKPPED